MRALHTQIKQTLDDQAETLTDEQQIQVLWDILAPLIERTTGRNNP
jgi:hypothetical protein